MLNKIITSNKKFMNSEARGSILSGFTKVLLKRVSIHLLLGLMLLSSFSSLASANVQPDLTPAIYTGSISSNGNDVYLNFDEAISINNEGTLTAYGDTVTAAVYLRSHMSIATDGVNFVPISELIDVQAPGEGDASSTQIYLYANNNMKVIFGTNTLIKIASDTLKDAAGNFNAEMILHVTPPVIQNAAISSDYHDVTITFQEGESVIDNTYSGEVSHLSDYIRLLRSGANTTQDGAIALTSDDTASVVDGKLVIHFATALSGATNQIKISGGALKDSFGNVLQDDTITPLIQGSAGTGDTTAPQWLNAYSSNNFQNFTLAFDEDVYNAQSDETSFRAGIQYLGSVSTGWNWSSIPSDATVTFSGKTVTIHFANPLPDYYIGFQFVPNSFKDASGNILNNSISTLNHGWINPPQTSAFTIQDGSFSHDGRWLNLNFAWQISLVDQTIVAGLSHLKDQITISMDHGTTFTALDAQDIVTIQGNRIVVFFHDAKKIGSVEVKIAANVLSDLGDNARNEAVDQVVAYNTPSITGYFLSNTASEFLFEDNAEWRSKVKDIMIYDDNNYYVRRQLNSSEYTLAAGGLTINKGVFQEGSYYYITIDADGYSSKNFEGYAHTSTELFYMTAPTVTVENGITAKVNILLNNNDSDYTGTQAVVFELMNGTIPVSIVTANLKVNTGMYSANFNVTDAETNPNYTVRTFVVNKFNNDPANVGLNLATIKTQDELDQISIVNGGNNNNP